MNLNDAHSQPFKLLRYYSLTSFAAFVVDAIALAWLCRGYPVRDLVQIADRDVISSYVQVRLVPLPDSIVGVFELYDDVTPFLTEIAHTQRGLLAGKWLRSLSCIQFCFSA